MYILTKLIFYLPALIFLISIFIFYSPFLQHMKGNLLHLNGKSFLLQKLDFYLAKKKIPNNFLFACLNIACEFLNLPTTLSKDIFFQYFSSFFNLSKLKIPKMSFSSSSPKNIFFSFDPHHSHSYILTLYVFYPPFSFQIN